MKNIKNYYNLTWGLKYLLLIILLLTLGKWAYFFLPKEYAEQTQIPTLEVVLTVFVSFCIIEIWRLKQEIKELYKKLAEANKIDVQN